MDKDDKLSKLKIQVEYYFSDENLEKDRFFHEIISKDPEGFLNLDYLLKCNNINKLAATKDEIANAVGLSKVVELDTSKSKVRRLGNKKLPELKLLKNKRKASEDNDKDEKEEEDNDEEDVDHTILNISTANDTQLRWKTILEAFQSNNKDINVVYIRFNKNLGHIGVQKKKNQDVKFNGKISVEGTDFLVEKCEGDDLINFWKEHGKHFERCVEENNKKKGKGKKKDKGKKPHNDRLKDEVNLGGEKFTDLGKIKARCRSILNLTKDNDKITGKDHDFLKDLVSKHKNGETKLKDLSFFTTGKPSGYENTRCFVIVKTDETKDDFSVTKILENLPRK